MTDKAVISEYTWRSLESQRKCFSEDIPVFILPYDESALFRLTRRQNTDTLHVISLGIIAENEKDFRKFMEKARDSFIVSAEGHTINPKSNIENSVALWRDARRNGAAKIGARISADKKKATTKEAVAKIKDRWPLPSKEWPTAQLLKEAGISLNTAKAHLGKRPIAQYNYQAAQKRKERRNAKN